MKGILNNLCFCSPRMGKLTFSPSVAGKRTSERFRGHPIGTAARGYRKNQEYQKHAELKKMKLRPIGAGLRFPDCFGNAVQQIGIACQNKKKIGQAVQKNQRKFSDSFFFF